MRKSAFLTTVAALALLPLGVAAEREFSYNYLDVGYLNNGMDGTVTAIDGQDRVDINIGDGSGVAIRASLALDRNLHVFARYSGSNMDLNATYTAPYPALDDMSRAFFTSPGAANWDFMCDLNGDGMVNLADLEVMRLADNDTRIASYAAVDGDMRDWKLGVGYHRLLSSKVDGFVQLFWEDRGLDFSSALFMGQNADISNSDSGFGAAVGLRGRLTDRFEMSGHVTYSPIADIDFLAAATNSDMITSATLFGIGGEYRFTDAFSLSAEAEGNGDFRSWLIAARYQLGG